MLNHMTRWIKPEKERTAAGDESNRLGGIVWPLALFIMLIGLVLLPIHIRQPFLIKYLHLKSQTAYINYFMLAVIVLLMATKKDYTKGEICLCILWLLLLIPVVKSNESKAIRKMLVHAVNCWLPIFLIIQRIDRKNRKKLLGALLLVFNIFVVVLLVNGFFEKATGHMLLRGLESWFRSHGFKCKQFTVLVGMLDGGTTRFCSIWGHPLTNAVLFNACFILNDIYYRSIKKRYPRMLLFAAAMTGSALLSVGKTAMVVCCLYLLLANWKKKQWLPIYVVGGAAIFGAGFFDRIMERFTKSTLTSGRLEAIVSYFSQDRYPLRLWSGYGMNTCYNKTLFSMKAAFEFPLLMFALDLGILFSILFIGSMFLYYSHAFLRRRQILSWMGLSLLFVQINTYNGISLVSQDIGWMNALFIMTGINSVMLTDDLEGDQELPEIKGGRVKKILTFLICGE